MNDHRSRKPKRAQHWANVFPTQAQIEASITTRSDMAKEDVVIKPRLDVDPPDLSGVRLVQYQQEILIVSPSPSVRASVRKWR
ncbi:hypothetical protein EVAR_35953_1 [Eumeta japonica]|uniref:Uncharacterized protein n=1 Tax=Eumeta variegata TaxID=151549 RepID=A0A4C1W6C5_EUMVA|nr:hypothetical protein EVAR_35953_1 [Eumeta japonica]